MKFRCSQCGFCCKGLGRIDTERPSREEMEAIKAAESKVNMMPAVLLNPAGTEGLYLYEWEYKRLKKKAEDMGLNVSFKPNSAVYDLKSNTALILDWIMNAKDCPFLKDKKCTAYEERPTECRRYPVLMTKEEGSEDSRAVKIGFNRCPSNRFREIILNEKEGDPASMQEDIKKAQDYFGETFLGASQNIIYDGYIQKTLEFAVEKGMIKPAIRHPMRFLLRRIENSRKISIFDFLMEKGFLSKKDYDEFVSGF